MADPKVPAPGATAETPPAAPSAEKVVPSFTAEVAKGAARRRGEIAESAGLPADTAVETPPAATEEKQLTRAEYDAWWNAQPENLRKAAASQFWNGYNNAIAEEYGDILPTIVAAKENPKLREILVELGDSTKPELLSLISDPEIRKHAKDLTKAELRDFLLNEAITSYNKFVVPSTTEGEPPKNEAIARVEALEAQLDDERVTREFNGGPDSYIQSRGREVSALKSAFSNLTQEQIAHVVDVAETRYETSAARAGIDTKKNGWQARAIRAGVKHPGYRDYATQYLEVLGKSAPPVAPAGTTKAPGSAGEAAPRDATESKRAAGVSALKDFKSKSAAFNRPTRRT